MPSHRPMIERFWARVDKTGPIPFAHPDHEGLGACWIFRIRNGEESRARASIAYDFHHLLPPGAPKRILVNRYSYEIHFGPIPDGQMVRHKCDNGHLNCVNPGHLELGTQAQNVQDHHRRGGVKRGHYERLSREQAAACREAYDGRPVTRELLARIANVRTEVINTALAHRDPGEPLKYRHTKITPDEVAVARAVVEAGGTVGAAATKIGRAWASVAKALRDAGVDVPSRTYNPITPEKIDAARAMIAGGSTLRQAAIAIGHDPTPLKAALARSGMVPATAEA